jgi:hypothetical protein
MGFKVKHLPPGTDLLDEFTKVLAMLDDGLQRGTLAQAITSSRVEEGPH